MSITAIAVGTLLGRIAILSIEDAQPSLAYKLFIPVSLHGEEATLSVDLLRPAVRSWRGLIGRGYLFNTATARHGKADGQTYLQDNVFGDLRTATGWYDTFITGVQFGSEAHGRLEVTVQGTLRWQEATVPFTVAVQVQVGAVILDDAFTDAAPALLDLEHYQPLQMLDKTGQYEPRLSIRTAGN